MAILADVDTEKTRLLLRHLGRASKTVVEKDAAKQKLQEQVSKLKKLSKAKEYRKEMRELEKRLADVVEKEEEIARHQKTRDVSNKRMRDKIQELEKRLTRYLEQRKIREKRIGEIEDKIRKRFMVEQNQIEIIEEQLKGLERIYENISSQKKHTKEELAAVKSKIEKLKNRLGKIK
jgi:chromosome segregation ATPase